ncbi:MAG TPA: hypothetical protein VJ890_21060 [Vineibacter sp.]|nr:hypothetical protein [Vineibacter sp.]
MSDFHLLQLRAELAAGLARVERALAALAGQSRGGGVVVPKARKARPHRRLLTRRTAGVGLSRKRAGKKGGRPPKVAPVNKVWTEARRLYEVEGWGTTRIAKDLKGAPNKMALWRRARAEKWVKPPDAVRHGLPQGKWVPEAKRLFEAGGLTFSQIARQLGVHHSTVRNKARAAGWTAPAPTQSPPAATIGPVVASVVAPAGVVPPTPPRPAPVVSRGVVRALRDRRFRELYAGDTPLEAIAAACGLKNTRAARSLASSLGLEPRPGDSSWRQRQLAHKAGKAADRDSLFIRLHQGGASLEALRTRFGFNSLRAVKRKAGLLGLPHRAGDNPAPRPATSNRRRFRASDSEREAAAQRMAAAAARPSDVEGAKLFLRRTGVVIFTAAVADRPDRPLDGGTDDTLKVDGRTMTPRQLVDFAIKRGFVPSAAAPVLRLLGARHASDASSVVATKDARQESRAPGAP